MKQEPNWMSDGQIIDGKTIRHKIPVGGAVEFYCNDTVKRPKKDVWDHFTKSFSLSHVAARQELRDFINSLGIPSYS